FDKIIASFTADYQIIDVKERNNTSRLKLKILNGKTSNEILSELMKYGNIISFNEEIPKLNEIFIDLVKK
ncbi:MAG: DUF4162 domain-containing protein, partial [Bacteroidota bacterium]|nr:DUF4162 domain-containing protein [Bacteroidota bacterium]